MPCTGLPVNNKLGKFESRLIEGVNLGYAGGGLYKVLTSRGILTTKHVRMVESEFPGTALLGDVSPDKSEKDNVLDETAYGYFEPDSDEEDLTLTYIPYAPAHELENGDTAPQAGDTADTPDTDLQSSPAEVPPVDTTLHGYNLRSRATSAIPDYISTSDDPSLCLRPILKNGR